MIVLDTNVVSELTRPDPNPTVVAWFDSLASDEQYLTAITAAELRYGAARLPHGRRALAMAEQIELTIGDYEDRVLPFDLAAAEHYGSLVVGRERVGRPLPTLDAQIASICAVWHAPLATRNLRDFEGTGIDLIDPWASPAP